MKVTTGFFNTKVQQCLIRKLKKTKQRIGWKPRFVRVCVRSKVECRRTPRTLLSPSPHYQESQSKVFDTKFACQYCCQAAESTGRVDYLLLVHRSWRRGGGGGGVYSYSADTIEGPRAPAVKLTAGDRAPSDSGRWTFPRRGTVPRRCGVGQTRKRVCGHRGLLGSWDPGHAPGEHGFGRCVCAGRGCACLAPCGLISSAGPMEAAEADARRPSPRCCTLSVFPTGGAGQIRIPGPSGVVRTLHATPCVPLDGPDKHIFPARALATRLPTPPHAPPHVRCADMHATQVASVRAPCGHMIGLFEPNLDFLLATRGAGAGGAPPGLTPPPVGPGPPVGAEGRKGPGGG